MEKYILFEAIKEKCHGQTLFSEALLSEHEGLSLLFICHGAQPNVDSMNAETAFFMHG